VTLEVVVHWAKFQLKVRDMEGQSSPALKLELFSASVPLLNRLENVSDSMEISALALEDGSPFRLAAVRLRDSMAKYLEELQWNRLKDFTNLAKTAVANMQPAEAILAEMMTLVDACEGDSLSKPAMEAINKKYASKPIKTYLSNWKFLFKTWAPVSDSVMTDLHLSSAVVTQALEDFKAVQDLEHWKVVTSKLVDSLNFHVLGIHGIWKGCHIVRHLGVHGPFVRLCFVP